MIMPIKERSIKKTGASDSVSDGVPLAIKCLDMFNVKTLELL